MADCTCALLSSNQAVACSGSKAPGSELKLCPGRAMRLRSEACLLGAREKEKRVEGDRPYAGSR